MDCVQLPNSPNPRPICRKSPAAAANIPIFGRLTSETGFDRHCVVRDPVEFAPSYTRSTCQSVDPRKLSVPGSAPWGCKRRIKLQRSLQGQSFPRASFFWASIRRRQARSQRRAWLQHRLLPPPSRRCRTCVPTCSAARSVQSSRAGWIIWRKRSKMRASRRMSTSSRFAA